MFEDRKDAGQRLGKALLPHKGEDMIILAIPKGGVEIAFYVAKALETDFHTIVCRKLRHPSQPELAFGAVAEDKSLYLNPTIRAQLAKQTIENAVKEVEKEVKRQVALYRKGHSLPSLKDKTVIVVDDGIATGSTLLVALEMCRKKEAGRLIVAAPVASVNMYQKLLDRAEEVIILEKPRDFMAVSQAYRKFSNLEDRDVLRFLKNIDKEASGCKSLST
jgi:predicted phosphoribosyltransferase